MSADDAKHIPPATAPASPLRRWLPLVVLAAIAVLVFAMGWHRQLTIDNIAANRDRLQGVIAEHKVLALLAYVTIYAAAVSVSLPGSLLLTLTGGLLFGWFVGGLATVVAATIGATIIFLVAKTALGESLAGRAGPAIAKLRDGFQRNALSYLLFLRLVPAFPFFVVNLAPAFLGVPLRTYVLGTFFGIIPGTVAFSVLGAGLGSAVESQNAIYNACVAEHGSNAASVCTYAIDTKALVTPELLAAFVLLGIVALIPVAIKKWSKRNANA